MRKSFVALAVFALLAAGCGGSKSGSASGGASGATITPADVLAFVLNANEFPPGKTELMSDIDMLAQIKILREQPVIAH